MEKIYKHIDDVTEDDAFNENVVAYNTRIIAGREVTYIADKFWKMSGDALESNKTGARYKGQDPVTHKETEAAGLENTLQAA